MPSDRIQPVGRGDRPVDPVRPPLRALLERDAERRRREERRRRREARPDAPPEPPDDDGGRPRLDVRG